MRFLDVIGPGDPGYPGTEPIKEGFTMHPAIIIGIVVVVVAVVLIIAVNIKKKGKN